MQTENNDVFISHSSKNSDLAFKICDSLEKNNIKVWIAPRDLLPGTPYSANIVNGIINTKIVLLLLTNESKDSIPVRREIERAGSHKKVIINLRLDDVTLDEEWEYLVSSLHWLDATILDYDSMMKAVVKSIKSNLQHINTSQSDTHSAPAAKSFLEFNADDAYEGLLKMSQDNKKKFIGSNSYKYISASYIERGSFKEFYREHQGEKSIFLLGEAGMGKTNELCHLMENICRDDVAFAFNSQLLDTPFENNMHSIFSGFDYSLKNRDVKTILKKIHEVAIKKNKHIYFLFDAINEATSYPVETERLKLLPVIQLLKDIYSLILSEKYTQFHVVASCRSTPFEYLKTKISTELMIGMEDIVTFSLEKYTHKELGEIFNIYRKQSNIQTSTEEFNSICFAKIRDSLSSPLLFSLVVKSYHDHDLPASIDKYDFVTIVKKLLADNIYLSNFKAYELLLRLTNIFRKKHIDSFDASNVLLSKDEELVALKNDFFTPEGKISNTSDILFKENYLKYTNTTISFVYEKIQEALYEISFFNEHENNYEGGVIPANIYEDIILNQRLEYDVVSYSYLCNAIVNNFLSTKDDMAIKNIVSNPQKRIQTLSLMVLSKLNNIGYEKKSRSLVRNMLDSKEEPILNSALNAIGYFFNKYETDAEYRNAVKNNNSPLAFLLYIFNNSEDDVLLNKTGVFLYNIILQNKHLTDAIIDELFDEALKAETVNINFLMQLGLLSFIIAIDILVAEDGQDVAQHKAYIQDNILKNWSQIMEKMFHTNCKFYHPKYKKASKMMGFIPAFLRNTLLRLGIRFGTAKYFTIQTDYTNNLKEYVNYWKNIPAKAGNAKWSKENFNKIADLFDVNNELTHEYEELIMKGIQTGDVFSFLMIERMLITRGLHCWSDIKRINEKAITLTSADTDYVDYIQMSHCYVLFHIIDKIKDGEQSEATKKETYDILGKVAYQWALNTNGRFKTPLVEEINQYGFYKQFVLNWYIVASCKNGDKYSLEHIPMLTKLVDETLDAKDNDRDLLIYIIENISIATTNLGKIHTALALYNYIVTRINSEYILSNLDVEEETSGDHKGVAEYKGIKIEDYMISVLNTMKSFFPDQVRQYEAEDLRRLVEKDNYLAKLILKKSKVITKTEETLGSLLTSRFGNFFVWGLNDNDIRLFIVQSLKASITKKNNLQWMLYCIRASFQALLQYKI